MAGQIGQIVSPELHGQRCVQFFYFMGGATVGELNVYVDDGVSKKIVWKLQRRQSSNWTIGMVPLQHSVQAVKVCVQTH